MTTVSPSASPVATASSCGKLRCGKDWLPPGGTIVLPGAEIVSVGAVSVAVTSTVCEALRRPSVTVTVTRKLPAKALLFGKPIVSLPLESTVAVAAGVGGLVAAVSQAGLA